MNNLILDKVDEIINYIKETSEYKDYLFLKDKVSKNNKINNLIEEVRTIEKELVKLEVNNKDITDLEKEYNSKLEELNKIPLYKDYVDTVEKLDNIYQDIKNRLDNYFYEKLN